MQVSTALPKLNEGSPLLEEQGMFVGDEALESGDSLISSRLETSTGKESFLASGRGESYSFSLS